MNDTEQRTAIAEACGWKLKTVTLEQSAFFGCAMGTPAWFPPDRRDWDDLECPDYLNDLNAMQSADPEGKSAKALCELLGITSWTSPVLTTQMVLKATARQRAEAFLKTIGKWKDESK